MTSLLVIAALSVGICAAVMPFARRLAVCLGLVDRPDGQRKMQTRPIPLAGGITVLLSVCGALGAVLPLADTTPTRTADGTFLAGLLAAAVVICGVGVVDDLRGLRGRHKLLGQLAAVGIVLASGVLVRNIRLFGWDIDLGMLAVPFTVFWLLGAINSLNLIDGMDGLLTCVGIIVSLALAGMALCGGQWLTACVAVALAGSLAGFLPYNFPPASCFLGDSGSMLIGLVVGVLAIHGSLKGPATVALLAPACVLTIPILDTGAAIVRRKLTGGSIFMTDRAHLHHCLLRRGLSSRRSLLYVSLFCLLTGVGALGSVAFRSEIPAAFTALAVAGILITTRLFGYTEFVLVRKCLLTFLLSLWEKPARGRTNHLEIRLQGSADWNELWERLTWEAFELNFKTICLDMNVQAIQEVYHAHWDRFDDQTEESDLWRVELPVVAGGHAVGRLQVTGPREGTSDVARTLALAKMVEDFTSNLWPLAASQGNPSAPRKVAVPLPLVQVMGPPV